MSPSCRSGNVSSGSLRCPGSSCGSFSPSNLVPSRDLCSSSRCPQGPSLRSSFQVICWEPSSSRPSRCSPRVPMLGSPCRAPLPGALGSGSGSSCSLGSGSGGLRPLGYGVCGVPGLSPGSGSCRPTSGTSGTSRTSGTSGTSGSCQSSCRQPACGSSCY